MDLHPTPIVWYDESSTMACVVRCSYEIPDAHRRTVALCGVQEKGGTTMPKKTSSGGSKVNKSAVTGRFVTTKQVAKSPKTTYRQTVKKG